MTDRIAAIEIRLRLAEDEAEDFTKLQPSELRIGRTFPQSLEREQVERMIAEMLERLANE